MRLMPSPVFFLLLLAAASSLGCREPADSVSAIAPAAPQVPPVPSRTGPPLVLPVKPLFRDVAREQGIDFTFYNDEVPGRYLLPEVMGGGAAWFDYDRDGKLDLFLANGDLLDPNNPRALTAAHAGTAAGEAGVTESVEAQPRAVDAPHNRLYRQVDSQFVDVSFAADTAQGGFGQGCCVADYDADGFSDLYVCNYGRNLLLHNNGDGTFTESGHTAGVDDSLWGTSPAWVDLNEDDWLDLFVTNYLMVTPENSQVCEYGGRPGYCGPGTYEAAPDRVFLSNGEGTFREAANELGFDAKEGKGLAVTVADFDGDAKPEIYVANDMAPNFLYHRVPAANPLRYENQAMRAGCAVSDEGHSEASMGIACADFDRDGWIDLYLTHYYSHKNTLYRNLGGLLFEDDSKRTRVAATSYETLGFGTVAFDYDQDGDYDLFVANGHVLGPLHSPNEMPAQLLHNDGQGRFDDVSKQAGDYFQQRWLGRGVAGADFDDDGDTDLLVTHLHQPVALLRNETQTPNHFIGFEILQANRLPPIGARVTVLAESQRIVLPYTSGGSYLCHSDSRLLVGLGASRTPVDVEVAWPSGQKEWFRGLAVDRYWRLQAGLGASATEDAVRDPVRPSVSGTGSE